MGQDGGGHKVMFWRTAARLAKLKPLYSLAFLPNILEFISVPELKMQPPGKGCGKSYRIEIY